MTRTDRTDEDWIPACPRCKGAEDMAACDHKHCEPCEECKP